jgi:hypothetical protein
MMFVAQQKQSTRGSMSGSTRHAVDIPLLGAASELQTCIGPPSDVLSFRAEQSCGR